MAAQNRTILKGYFNTGDVPTEAQFANLIDSFPIGAEDGATADQTGAEIVASIGAELAGADGMLTVTGGTVVTEPIVPPPSGTGWLHQDASGEDPVVDIKSDAEARTLLEAVRSSAAQAGAGSSAVGNVVTIGQAAYAALSPPDTGTLYVVVGA